MSPQASSYVGGGPCGTPLDDPTPPVLRDGPEIKYFVWWKKDAFKKNSSKKIWIPYKEIDYVADSRMIFPDYKKLFKLLFINVT